MTINDVIINVQELKPFAQSKEAVTRWLSDLDNKMADEQGISETDFPRRKYQWSDDENTHLLAPEPYSELYILYVISMIDFYNRELQEYTNDSIMANAAIKEYKGWYIRNHPSGTQTPMKVI